MGAVKFLRAAAIETKVMGAVFLAACIALGAVSFSAAPPPAGMPAGKISGLLLGFFLLSFTISLIAAVTGIGGGVLFTPVMLAFTPVDSLIIRATGMILAMFTGLVSTGPFMRRGLGNLRMCVLFSSAFGAGAFSGARGAVYIWKYSGEAGESFIRIALGLIVLAVAAYLLLGGKRAEWPEVKIQDMLTRRLNLSQPYYEQSLNKIVDYRLVRAGQGIAAMALVGGLSGFFGLGAGWAVVPVHNLVVGAPLKVAAANSLALVGMGGCMAIWPYLLTGAVIPLFAAPWLAGVVFGGKVGSSLLINIRAGSIRCFLIGILIFTGFSLVARGLDMLGVVTMRPWMSAALFFAVILVVFRAVIIEGRGCGCGNEKDKN